MFRDARGLHRVVVTGLGLASPLGVEVGTFWENVIHGAVATGPVTRFRTDGYPTHVAAEVSDPALTAPLAQEGPDTHDTRHAHDTRDAHDTRAAPDASGVPPRSVRYVRHSAHAALSDAKLLGHEARRRTGVVLGTVMGTRPHLEELRRAGRPLESDLSWDTPRSLVQDPARAFGLGGPRQVVAAGCAAGNTAIAMAADHIRAGRADAMVTGGVDELSEAVFALFTSLRALSPDVVRPFDRDRRGMLPSEGAGVLVLESLEHALGRGAAVLAELRGSAVAADAHHMTAPHPEGTGMLRCMRESLAQGGLDPGDVDYVSAHGTGTPANDALEGARTADFFRAAGARPAVSSVKGLLGHAQGGASALEAIVCVLAIRHGQVPGSPTLRHVDESCADLDIVRGASRETPVRTALSNSFGFGGNTATVVLSRYEP